MNPRHKVLWLVAFLGLFGMAKPMSSMGIDAQIKELMSSKLRALGIEKASVPNNVVAERKEPRVLQPSGTNAAKEAEKKALVSRRSIELQKMLARWYLSGDSDVRDLTAVSALKSFVAAAEVVGDYDACLGLAYCFANGVEMPVDQKQAQAWFDEADRLLRKHYRFLMTGAESGSKQDESAYVKHEVDLIMNDFKHRNFGLLEGVLLDCAGSPCHGCENNMVEDDSILVIKLMTTEGWRLFIGHQKCHQAMMWKLKITSLDCTCGHAMNKETSSERLALFRFGAGTRRS